MAAPPGWWPSPLEAMDVALARRSRSLLRSDGEHLYWVEARPDQGGRQALVRWSGEGIEDVTGPAVSVRSRVHEYGGGAYCLVSGGGPGQVAVAYVDQADQRIRVLPAGGGAEGAAPCSPAPPEGAEWRHGDLAALPGGQVVLAVREWHAGTEGNGGPHRPRRDLVAYQVGRSGPGAVLVTGRDFLTAPRPDPTGKWLAWLAWDHPDMPWDAAELWVGHLGGGAGTSLSVSGARRVAGGWAGSGPEVGESVGQPLWCADGSLVFMSDATGWWQPWRWVPGEPARRLTDDPAEYHGPDWQLGQATVVELPGGTRVCRRRRLGVDQVVLVDPQGREHHVIAQPAVSVAGLCAHRSGVAWLGATPDASGAVWALDAAGLAVPGLKGGVQLVVPPVADAGGVARAPVKVSAGRAVTVGVGPGRAVHGLYFRPVPAGPESGGPPFPLVVHCHGGPTGAADAGFDPLVQFFTTRGIAVAAVDYAGSTGYGRAFRRSLWGQWGVADAADCVAVACHLVGTGEVDPERMAVRGSSAGGFTALCAMDGEPVFGAAASWYGVTDLLALAAATHDFEAHYQDRLVGPLPATAATHQRRSPVSRAAGMHGRILLLQGTEDPVVPPAQAEAMARALERAGVPVTLVVFPGEGHGFRQAGTVARALDTELAFYRETWTGGGPTA